MIYPANNLSTLPLLLKGFRKAEGLTQAAIAERLGISQQGYSKFEADPASASVDRLLTVLQLFGVEVLLQQHADKTVVTEGVLPSPSQTEEEW